MRELVGKLGDCGNVSMKSDSLVSNVDTCEKWHSRYRWQKHPQLMFEAISMLSKRRQYVSLITADDYNVESDSFASAPFLFRAVGLTVSVCRRF
ncbi:hypothetical protein ALC56_01965 [Trachymyrmex septentrionalis]|uniref:Uncharacterized protein n=1 Tax=Trachymyrmex septentrionalis TaxID=34720 RepID=A0A195FTC3_9HYME|nr:hypothetical protein ALC56_01965 [Trachymyrmex septentrionalis]